jgi:Putative auto-transporter adhesin, head GIN domain
MRYLKAVLAAGLVSLGVAGYAQPGPVDHFDKVIISPYIQATFVEGDKESVAINGIIVDSNKLHVEVKHGTLRVYLDGTKDIPHNHDYNDEKEHSHPSYPKHAVIATITYRKLSALSLRGEETYLCESPLSANQFHLRVYGESRVIFTEVHFQKLHTTIYGESTLDIKSGVINKQYYTCYGEGKVNTTGIAGRESKLTAYGEAEFKLNVSDRIKISAIGQAKLRYMGNPDIVKGIHIGGVDMQKLD